MEWIDRLPRDFPWYLAVQDGMTTAQVSEVLPRVGGLLLGGSTAFKETAATWCELAHAHGKLFHFARISRMRWVRAAIDIGADSADSSQPLWSGDHWRRFEKCVHDARAQTSLHAGMWYRSVPTRTQHRARRAL